jgi:hypothetical protein
VQTPYIVEVSKNNQEPTEEADDNDYNGPLDPKKTVHRNYGINYGLVLMMQLLGIGPDGLGIIFAFLGIATSKGCYDKWKQLQDEVGIAEEDVYNKVIKENMEQELQFLRDQAKKDFNKWYFEEGGRNCTEAVKIQKMRDLLHINPDGRIGIAVQCDEGWQKRAIGFSGGNSKSGHNLAIGCGTLKILNKVVYSKQCTTCQWYRKRNRPLPGHRCSKNFDKQMSSKSMEAKATVQHKLDIDTGDTGAYVHTLLTDDDSTVRANMLHSYKAVADRDYPGWNEEGGVGKAGTDWPYDVKVNKKGGTYKHYHNDYGKIPLALTAVSKFISDVGHRVKCIAKMIFSFKYKSKKPEEKGEIGLHKWECLKLKKLAGYYFKDPANQELPFEEFKCKAHCIYLHHFNDHSCCNESWCKVLKSRRQIDPLPLTEQYMKRFRCKEKDRELFLLLKKGYETYLRDEALLQIHHLYSTNKNESLNRRITSVAPKDRYFSGTMSLSDRVSKVVITDSIGYMNGYKRILHKVNSSLELPPILQEWCKRKDRRYFMNDLHHKKPEVKKRRMEAINKEIAAGRLSDIKSLKEGYNYGAGIAMDRNTYCNEESSEGGNKEEEEEAQMYLDRVDAEVVVHDSETKHVSGLVL